ncbi:preprotein translocase subunit SecE [Methylicorpusculum oleiharenae]|uniref:preprotein translocase subunit SecE n=1 Tax=Methylicorpusculum oleiharenae TaxID=1338687 RepID=UPI00135A6030|nr:preprotein translocase subunit SecE [Methylicorpusculum oleiharenae]MCD2450059.1 preprotein translocase subunit SecE [Methylicorpusculum oleiharenae]
MNTQVEPNASSMGDVVKQVASLVFVIAGLAAFYYFSSFPLLYRVLGLVAVVVLALGLMLTTTIGKGVWAFMLESKQEVRKVVWPNRQETIRTTLLVFAMVFIVGLILWVLDMFLFWGIRLLTGQGV